ncbi:MAG: phosphopantetheinyl transferase [Massilia sp.]|nr:phosphopantetheinyl transferase [Massilia sp.]
MSALTVLHWPAQQAAWESGLLALCTQVPPGGARETARADIRAAICEAAGQLTGVGPERIEVAGTAGQRPRLLVDGEQCGIGISISHADTLSLAVLHRDGAVGADLMQIGLPVDWARVAHDYIGMTAATLLAASLDEQRPLAFCRAWVRLEAALKLDGEKLREADAVSLQAAEGKRFIELALPDGLTGVVALD